MIKRKTKTRGFTLIELLVVIAIIGILSSVVLASLNSARKKSRDARRIADVKQLQLALELYFDSASPNAYPATLGALSTGGHIATVPKDPLGTSVSYAYEKCSGTVYHLGASLEEDHNALDSDLGSATAAVTPTGCSGAWGEDDVSCCAAVGTGCTSVHSGSNCYDVSP